METSTVWRQHSKKLQISLSNYWSNRTGSCSRSDHKQHLLSCQHIDEDVLAQLPHDRNLSNISSIAAETPPTSDQMSDDDDYDAHLARSFIPVATRSMTEQKAVQQSVRRQSDHPSAFPTSTVMWPSSGGIPINEFTTEGYFYLCLLYTLSYWSTWFSRSETQASHYWQLLQTPHDVWGWPLC